VQRAVALADEISAFAGERKREEQQQRDEESVEEKT
jgi:hypothetical protein